MSTPHDGLANVIADVSFNIAGNQLTLIDSFQVGPSSPPANAGDVVAGTLIGIALVSQGIVDVAIDEGKGAGPVNVGTSLQCEFSAAYTGPIADGSTPMMHTVKESGVNPSTPNVRIYRFQFFQASLGPASAVVQPAMPAQCTITIRRKKELLPS